MIEDPDFDDEEEAIEPLVGNPPSSGGAGETSEILIEMLCAITKLSVFLQEAEESEFKVFKPRLLALQYATAALPTSAAARRRMGFQVQAKPKSKAKKRR